MLDTIILGAKIIDGTGQPSFEGNIGIKNGKICFPDAQAEAEHIIDGRGLTVCPGFIDSHSHTDLCLGADPAAAFFGKISQGITSEVTGQCGLSLFPTRDAHLKELRDTVLNTFVGQTADRSLSDFTSFEAFLSYADKVPKIANYAYLVGHCVLRAAVMGIENRKATALELEQMKELLREAMEHGAKGLSSGLVYIPGAYADKEELIELCRVMKPYGGIYTTHMRNEADLVVESVAESIEIAETAGVSLVISHHKVCGKQNWGASADTLELIHRANERGVRVYLDMYPYHATQTTLSNCLNPVHLSSGTAEIVNALQTPSFREQIKKEMQAFPPAYDNPYINAGGFSGILISNAPFTPDAVGFTIAQYAAAHHMDGFDAFFSLLIENRMQVNATYFSLNEEEMLRIYLDRYAMVGTDALCRETPGPAHPRCYGSFVKPIADFVNKRHLLSLEECIRKQTGLTASVWNLSNKGILADGYDADLVLFDETAIQDMATFENGTLPARGIISVFVNGQTVYDNGRLTEARPGKTIISQSAETL